MTDLRQVAILFARADSDYKSLPGCDVWDIERDARNWLGGCPVVAHPPCRAWGRLRQFAKPRDDEKDLARFAVRMIRQWGGVLEHPAQSTLWADQDLPVPGAGFDTFGGWSFSLNQHSFGHRATKPTWLYMVGCAPSGLPVIPLMLGDATHCIRPTKNYPRKPSVTKREREHTPAEFARWLVEFARRTTVSPARPRALPSRAACPRLERRPPLPPTLARLALFFWSGDD